MTGSAEIGVAAAVLGLMTTRSGEPTGVLHDLVGAVRELSGLAAGAAVLADGVLGDVVTSGPDRLRTVFTTGFADGPGADCAHNGRPVPCDDLVRQRHRWLAFVAKALAADVGAAWAFPIGHGPECAGALLVIGDPDAGTDLPAAGLLAESAAIALRHRSERELAERENRQLRTALRSRVVVEQAKGMLAAYAVVDMDTAFELLRGHSRRHRRPLADTAAAVVRREITPGAVADRP